MTELPPATRPITDSADIPLAGDDSPELDRNTSDPTHEHRPLHVEKLEGRQETGRDAQDESEQDESPD